MARLLFSGCSRVSHARQNPMTRKLLLDTALFLLLAILGIVAYKLAPLLSPKTDIALPLSACNPGLQSCAATLPDGGQLVFSLTPLPVPALKPLQIEVTVRGSDIRQIEVDFAGTDMKMGFNRPLLKKQGDRFVGQASLPVCITGTMDWEATVLVETAQSLIAVPFRFSTTSE